MRAKEALSTQITPMWKIHTNTITLLASITVLFATSTHANSPVWEIKKGDNTVFIGGTIHLLSEQDYPLPSTFESAYKKSDSIVFETDISQASALATQAKMLPVIMTQDGTTLESRLDKATFTRLTAYLEERNLPIAMFQALTPAGINLTLLALELQKLGVNSESGVESYFNSLAVKDNKPITWLESIDEQIAVLAAMNQIDPNLTINTTLDDMHKLPTEWAKLLGIWRKGDMPALKELGIDTMIDASPELYDALVVKRNNNWAPKIMNMLDTPDTEFVLVGALHLAGKDSVLKLIDTKTVTIRQLNQ